jgi:DNA-binding PadR family transcriptional regulator
VSQTSSTRLLVLGVVRIFQPVHGYDVRRELLSWRVDEWGNVNPGSIYHALKSLERDAFLRVAEVGSEGGRPARTTYELTEDGETEFFTLLRESLWRTDSSSSSLLAIRAGLPFFPQLHRDELMAMLQSRIAQLESAQAAWDYTMQTEFKPEHVKESFYLAKAQISGELEWARGFLGRLKDGCYTVGDERA